ncbi:MAG: hypothetical protein ACREHF_12355 [Rhizomicrobium sp.]
MRRLIVSAVLLALAGSLAGCVAYGPGPRHGWCYWHPYRCR